MPSKELGAYIKSHLPSEVLGFDINVGGLTLNVHSQSIGRVLHFLRDDSRCLFHQLIDIFGVDYPGREKRFDVIYLMLSMHKNHRISVKVQVNDSEAIPSITDFFPSANWPEREVWDMFGIIFSGHTDLRRLLTDYGFEGHPLRKDFPLTGYTEVRYDDIQKRVIQEPVSLPQEYRSFDFLSPWEGGHYHLPGDEKAEVKE